MRRLRQLIGTLPVVLGVAALAVAGDDVVRLSEADGKALVVTRAAAQYPAVARQLHLEATMILDVTIEPSGAVGKVDVVKGNSVFSQSAVQAIKSWKFKAYKDGEGNAARAIVTVSLNYHL